MAGEAADPGREVSHELGAGSGAELGKRHVVGVAVGEQAAPVAGVAHGVEWAGARRAAGGVVVVVGGDGRVRYADLKV